MVWGGRGLSCAADSLRSPTVLLFPGITVGLNSVANLVWGPLHGVSFTPRADPASHCTGQEQEIKEAMLCRCTASSGSEFLPSRAAKLTLAVWWRGHWGDVVSKHLGRKNQRAIQKPTQGKEMVLLKLCLTILCFAQEEKVSFYILGLSGRC